MEPLTGVSLSMWPPSPRGWCCRPIDGSTRLNGRPTSVVTAYAEALPCDVVGAGELLTVVHNDRSAAVVLGHRLWHDEKLLNESQAESFEEFRSSLGVKKVSMSDLWVLDGSPRVPSGCSVDPTDLPGPKPTEIGRFSPSTVNLLLSSRLRLGFARDPAHSRHRRLSTFSSLGVIAHAVTEAAFKRSGWPEREADVRTGRRTA